MRQSHSKGEARINPLSAEEFSVLSYFLYEVEEKGKESINRKFTLRETA